MRTRSRFSRRTLAATVAILVFATALLAIAASAARAELLPWRRELARQRAITSALESGAIAAPGHLAAAQETGLWSQWPPTGRGDHAIIYDPVRDRVLVFGGEDGQSKNDVWVLTVGGEPTWSRLETSGTPPAARDGHSAIYDPVRDRLIVFGGHNASEALFNDVWALSLSGAPTWELLAPAGALPLPRFTHAAAYDAARDRMIVFGGYGGVFPFYLNDTWELSLAGVPAWAQLAPAGALPVSRYEPSMVYDAPRDRMILFGGYDGNFLGDTWELSLAAGTAWNQLAPSGPAPVGRVEATLVSDPTRDRILLFGGFDGDELGLGRSDVWALSIAGSPAWTQLVTGGSAVPGRYFHGAVVDPVRDQMLVFSGYSALAYPHDTWVLSLASPMSWAQLAPAGGPPPARSEHSTIYDPVRNEVILFGGRTGTSAFNNDVWRLTLDSTRAWTRVATSGTPPSPRRGHSAIYDAQEDRMIVVGGDDGARRNDVWALSLGATPGWTLLTPTGTPPQARHGHSAIYDPAGDRMILFGGLGSGYNNDTWFLLLSASPAWVEHTPAGALPFVRTQHSAVLDTLRARMIVVGGRAGSYQSTVWSLDLTGTQQWTQILPAGGRPIARAQHIAIYDPERDRLLVLGGLSSSKVRDEAWFLDLSGTPTWTRRLIVDDAPGPRKGHTAVYDSQRDRMIVCSGEWEFGLRTETWVLSWDEVPGGDLAKRAELPTVAASAGFEPDWVGAMQAAALVRLDGPAPNPFSTETTIGFSMPEGGAARVDVFDASGRRVRKLFDGSALAGAARLVWDGRDDRGASVARGVYFLRLTGADAAAAPTTKKVIRR